MPPTMVSGTASTRLATPVNKAMTSMLISVASSGAIIHQGQRPIFFDFHVVCGGCYEGQRFDLRFLRPFRADLSIKKSSSFFPPLIAATSQRGLAPRPAHVSPEGPRYFGGTFLPLKTLARPRTTTLLPPPTAILSNC